LKRLNGTPYWVVAHGIDAWNITNPRIQVALGAADRILCVSSYTRDRLLYPLIYQPSSLRQKVIAKFGFEYFQQVVGELIQNHAPVTNLSYQRSFISLAREKY
jgi:hypothetical protein